MPCQTDTVSIALGALLDAFETPTALIAADYRIHAANRAYCLAYGVSAEAVVGRTCHEVSHASPEPCHRHGEDCPHPSVFGSGARCVTRHLHRNDDGTVASVDLSACLVRDTAGVPFMMESLCLRPPQDQQAQCPPREASEAETIVGLLQRAYNRRQIAAELGVSERTLYRKLHKYALG